MKHSSDSYMELDLFLPKERLALEYQGEQHYRDVYAIGDQNERMQRDDEKREACKSMGIQLIEIPYWWDKSIDSLAATISQHNPDVLPGNIVGYPIPKEPIEQNISSSTLQLTHGINWDGKQDLTGW
jgi:hypothetical protein